MFSSSLFLSGGLYFFLFSLFCYVLIHSSFVLFLPCLVGYGLSGKDIHQTSCSTFFSCVFVFLFGSNFLLSLRKVRGEYKSVRTKNGSVGLRRARYLSSRVTTKGELSGKLFLLRFCVLVASGGDGGGSGMDDVLLLSENVRVNG
jgi:hypothetical protein